MSEAHYEKTRSAKSSNASGVVKDMRVKAIMKTPPVVWKAEAEQQVPPFFNAKLGFPLDMQPADASSRTWSVHPEPVIFSVNWTGGGTDEFYRLQHQVFTIFKATSSATGRTSAFASYEANLVSAGKGWNSPPPMSFTVTLEDQGGGFLEKLPAQLLYVHCHDNYSFVYQASFDAGLFDIVTGFSFNVTGAQNVQHCP